MNTHEDDEIMCEGKWLRLVKRGRWEFAQRTVGAVAAVIVGVTTDDELVLIEQYRPPVGAMTIELPAGLIGDIAGEEDEAPERAAARELEEETGFAAEQIEVVARGTASAGLSDEGMILLRARGLKRVGEGGGVEHEQIITHLVELDRVDAWLAEQAAAGKVIDLKIYAGLHFCRR